MLTLALLAVLAANPNDEAIERAFQKDGVKAVVDAARNIEQTDDAGEAVKTLVRLLKHDNVKLRAAAAHTLGGMKEAGKTALPEIVRALSGDVYRLPKDLNELGPGDIPIWLAEAVLRPNNLTDANWALGYLGLEDERLVPICVKALSHEDLGVRWHAVGFLSDMGEKAAAARPALVRLLAREPTRPKQPDEAVLSSDSVLESTLFALGCIGSKPKQTVVLLTQMLKHKKPGMRQWSALGLGRMGKNAKAAIPALIELLSDDESALEPADCAYGARPEHAASVALLNIGKDSLPALIQTLSSKQPAVRMRVAEVLNYFGPEATAATDPLFRLLLDQDARVREEAINAIHSIAPKDKRLVPALVRMLDDPSPNVRESMTWLIIDVAPRKVLESAIDRLLNDPDEDVRDSASEARKSLTADEE